MCVPFVHHFHPKIGTVENVSPGVNDLSLFGQDRLVEVEAVQVESHGADAQGSEPDADNGPSSQEEVKATAVVEGCVLEDQTTEVAVSCNDVVGLFLLSKLVAIVEGLFLSGFTYE